MTGGEASEVVGEHLLVYLTQLRILNFTLELSPSLSPQPYLFKLSLSAFSQMHFFTVFACAPADKPLTFPILGVAISDITSGIKGFVLFNQQLLKV